MSINISLNKDEYTLFMEILSMCKETCSDVSIVDGKILQFNDNKNILYDVDLIDLIGENTMYLASFPNNFKNLDIFRRQHCSVNIELTPSSYKVGDKESYVELTAPDPTKFTNKPIGSTNKRSIIYKDVDKGNSIILTEFSNLIRERINEFRRNLEANSIVVKMDGGVITFTIESESGAIRSTIYENSDIDSKYSGKVKFPIDMFLIGEKNTQMSVKLYLNKSKPDMVSANVETIAGVEPQIYIDVWSVSTILELQ